jgi:hypothetical protein
MVDAKSAEYTPLFMNILRQICQFDYPDTLTAENKPANASACVLACLHMVIESMTQQTILEHELYNMLKLARVIREDCYINNYDDALRLVLMQRQKIMSPADASRFLALGVHRWSFFKKIEKPENAPGGVLQFKTPFVAYMKERQHAVLLTTMLVNEAGELEFQGIDPKFRGEKARKTIFKPQEFSKYATFI